MKSFSVFDILGPTMIGPSSSHTAGAARIGKIARNIAGDEFVSVDFYLHGSFAKTYRGHGTDRALVAGVLGMETYDERLRNSLEIANKMGIAINFIESDLGDEHPNTVKMVFTMGDNRQFYVIGSSIGGGNVIINNINGDEVSFTGQYPTLIIKHRDIKGMISKVSSILALEGINIGTMKVTRQAKGQGASMIIETDSSIPDYVVKELTAMTNIISVRAINPVK